VNASAQPIAVILTPGQAGDNPQLMPLLAQIDAHDLRNQAGRRVKVQRVLADKAYSHPSTRTALRARRIKATIPERRDQQKHRAAKGSRGGRPPTFDPDRYRGRNVVERCFNRLKQFRALATRYAKRAAYYHSAVLLACIILHIG
jgi:transposase